MKLTDSTFGLVFSAVACTTAGVLVAVAAFRGAHIQRSARLMIAVSVLAIALSYWLDAMGDVGSLTLDMRRGSGWALWPAMAWSAWIVIRRRSDPELGLGELFGGGR